MNKKELIEKGCRNCENSYKDFDKVCAKCKKMNKWKPKKLVR